MPTVGFFSNNYWQELTLTKEFGLAGPISCGLHYAKATVVDHGKKGKCLIINGSTWKCDYVPGYSCYNSRLKRTWDLLANDHDDTLYADQYCSVTTSISCEMADAYNESSITFHRVPHVHNAKAPEEKCVDSEEKSIWQLGVKLAELVEVTAMHKACKNSRLSTKLMHNRGGIINWLQHRDTSGLFCDLVARSEWAEGYRTDPCETLWGLGIKDMMVLLKRVEKKHDAMEAGIKDMSVLLKRVEKKHDVVKASLRK
jgi:hypothetical protein